MLVQQDNNKNHNDIDKTKLKKEKMKKKKLEKKRLLQELENINNVDKENVEVNPVMFKNNDIGTAKKNKKAKHKNLDGKSEVTFSTYSRPRFCLNSILFNLYFVEF